VGGTTRDGTGVTPTSTIGAEAARRVALVQLAVGMPALFMVIIGLVIGYRLVGLPLGGVAFWCVLGPVLGAFALYFARAIFHLRHATGGPSAAGPTASEE